MSCEHYSEDLPSPLYDHVAGYSHHCMYIMGGFSNISADGAAGAPVTAVYKWDLSSDNQSEWFTQIASIPDLQWDSHGVSALFPVENILFAIGVYRAAHTVNKFDTASNQWLLYGEQSPRKVAKGCVSNNGSHFVMVDGVDRFGGTDLKFVFIQFYDPTRNVWSVHTVDAPFSTTALSTGQDFIDWRLQYCAFVDNKLYIFGGKIGSGTYLDGMWRYDTLSQQFIDIGTLPQPCAYGTTAVDDFGNMYLVGCWSESLDYTNEIWVFDASTETIAAEPIYSRHAIARTAAVVFNNSLWIFGGWNADEWVVSSKIQICDISSFLLSTNITIPVSSTEPSTQPSATPTASPSTTSMTSGNNESTELLLSIIIVFAALGCFCVAVLFYLRSRKKRNEEEAQPKNDIASVQAQPMSMPQPLPVIKQPLVMMHMRPYPNSFPPPPPPQSRVPQFVARDVVRQFPVPAVAHMHVHPNPPNAGRGEEEKFVYDPDMNYKKEGARASILTPTFTPQVVDDNKSYDDDGTTTGTAVNRHGAYEAIHMVDL